MKTSWISIGCGALAALLAAACQDSDANQKATTTHTTSAETNTTAQPAAGAPAPVGLSNDDKEFVTKAAQGGMLEVALGKQVATNGARGDVKAFGDRMVADHSKADDELARIAASKGVTVPTQLDKDHQKILDKMSKLSGPKLDKEYSADMVDDHEEDVKEFKEAAKDVKDPDLRAWAERTLPTLESHLAMAKDIKAKTKKN